MKFNINKTTIIPTTFKGQYVKWKFDISGEKIEDNFEWEIPIEWKEWNIWVIVWPSWTGKSTIAKELFGDKFVDLSYGNKAVIDEIDWNIDEVIDMFNKVGFNTPKSWLKPYHVLSNGEKMRVDLAKALVQKQDIIIFDEYTSVVDRVVAQVASYALQKTIRKSKKKFIAVTCHYDILDWLEPDWVFDTKDFTFTWGVKLPNTKDLQLNAKSDIEVWMNERYLQSIII